MWTLYEIIEETERKLEKMKVTGTNNTLADYVHGRCHLFAQALHEELGYEMEFLWDDEYWFEDSNVPTIVLVHAFCHLPKGKPFKGKYVDARGGVSKRAIEQSFEFNSSCYEKYDLEKLKKAIKNKILCKPEKNEIKMLKNYIRKNIKTYS